MPDKEKIMETLNRYIAAVHTQDEEEFKKIWLNIPEATLISITKVFTGIDTINSQFLSLIRNAYTKIDLIAESVEINLIDETTAVVIFKYHTECIKRDDGEPFGIKGLETQLMKKTDEGWKLVHVHYSK